MVWLVYQREKLHFENGISLNSEIWSYIPGKKKKILSNLEKGNNYTKQRIKKRADSQTKEISSSQFWGKLTHCFTY